MLESPAAAGGSNIRLLFGAPHFAQNGQLAPGGPITAEALYPRWANFQKPNDILVAETGTSSMGLGFALMPKGATFHNQTL
jgi:indolepyruvate decarboxylase